LRFCPDERLGYRQKSANVSADNSSLAVHQDYSHVEWQTINAAVQAIEWLPKP
jgi:hypothetical protein